MLNRLIAEFVMFLFITTIPFHTSNRGYKIRINDEIHEEQEAEHLHSAQRVIEDMNEAHKKYVALANAIDRYIKNKTAKENHIILSTHYSLLSEAMLKLINSESSFMKKGCPVLNPYISDIYSHEQPNDSLLILLRRGIQDSLINYSIDNSIKSKKEILDKANEISSDLNDHITLYHIYKGLSKREANFIARKYPK